jgi:ATP-dependent Clp protease adapter protein ClpS
MSCFTIQFLFIVTSLFSSSSALTSKSFNSASRVAPWGSRKATSLSGVAAPTISDKTTVFAQPETTKKSSSHQKSSQEGNNNEWWELRLYDDNDNFDYYVAECLVKVAGISELHAYRAMKTAHVAGEASLGTYAFEQAEWCKEALNSNGLVVDIFPLDFL